MLYSEHVFSYHIMNRKNWFLEAKFLRVVLWRWIAIANVLTTFVLPPPLFSPFVPVPQLPSTISPLSCSDSTSTLNILSLPAGAPWKIGSNDNLSLPVPPLLTWPKKYHPVTQAETTTQMLSSTLTGSPKSCAPFFPILGILHIFIATIPSLHLSFIQLLPFVRFLRKKTNTDETNHYVT